MLLATFKHISSKNADYSAAEAYLTFEHDEFTMKPTLTNTTVVAMFMYTSLSILCELWKFRSCRIWTDPAIPNRA